ncbi:ABC transporter permease [Trueperella pecoris]|uniref:ABC transporter permease n=1 Tax=Trueperella pecoris TaxID=2733571 RepID=A0A7M1QVF2_9ACTO|nr:ABC transporter permease [Trueperella pecoris]QOR45846.1 ABC transporter permease [Trueperella pecoris]
MNDATRLLITTGMGLAVMVVAILGLQCWAGLRVGAQPLVAALRAVAQLAALALVLHGIFQYPWTAVLMLAGMLTVAALTSGNRLRQLPYGRRAAALGISSAALIVVALIFSMQMMELTVSNFIAVGGMITGNSMSAATLSGRRFMASSQAQRGEVEGWFALGARPQQAFSRVSRTAVEEMLLPTIDKTKSTGLVTMPGAFVGALIGGASPVEAARFQLVVLVGIMLAETICGIIVTKVLSRATVIASPQESSTPKADAKSKASKDAKANSTSGGENGSSRESNSGGSAAEGGSEGETRETERARAELERRARARAHK